MARAGAPPRPAAAARCTQGGGRAAYLSSSTCGGEQPERVCGGGRGGGEGGAGVPSMPPSRAREAARAHAHRSSAPVHCCCSPACFASPLAPPTRATHLVQRVVVGGHARVVHLVKAHHHGVADARLVHGHHLADLVEPVGLAPVDLHLQQHTRGAHEGAGAQHTSGRALPLRQLHARPGQVPIPVRARAWVLHARTQQTALARSPPPRRSSSPASRAWGRPPAWGLLRGPRPPRRAPPGCGGRGGSLRGEGGAGGGARGCRAQSRPTPSSFVASRPLCPLPPQLEPWRDPARRMALHRRPPPPPPPPPPAAPRAVCGRVAAARLHVKLAIVLLQLLGWGWREEGLPARGGVKRDAAAIEGHRAIDPGSTPRHKRRSWLSSSGEVQTAHPPWRWVVGVCVCG